MTDPVRLAIAGAGLIGRRHVGSIAQTDSASVACLIDPSEPAADFAKQLGVPHFRSLDAAIGGGGIDGVILATPNQLHVEGALACIDAGLPVLVEKPLASDVAGGRAIAEAGDRAGVAVLTGHHRRHNPIIARARAMIEGGELGTLASVQATTWFRKPDPYFDVEWRRKKGAGPIYINLIHDIDLMQYLAGPIVEVRAMQSSAVRGFEVEDTAVILLRFASGTLGTMNLSDTAAAPWSWELTARENPAYPATRETAYWIGGTRGSLALPNLALWSHPGEQSWWAPISAANVPIEFSDPLVRQIDHFAEVIRGKARPIVSARDGLAALAAVEAVKLSAETGQAVVPDLQG